MNSTETAWEGQLIERIAAEIRRLRTSQNMSAQALADRVASLGVTMSRSTIADIENGRRKFITVAELLAIANALNAAPAMLVFPGPYTDFELVDLPGSPRGPIGRGHKTEAIRWFCGESLNDRLIVDFNAYEENRRPLREARELEELEREKISINREIRSHLEKGENDDLVEYYTRRLLHVNRKIEQAKAK